MDSKDLEVKERTLTAGEIKAVNAIRDTGKYVDLLIEEMESNPELDQRWVANAKNSLQTGFMQAEKAVTK